jgi:branched-chain amino acid aminotransferase
MSTADLIWFNGKMIPWGDATVHVMSHAIHYGSSVFEGVRAYETPNGTAIFRLNDHTKRLFDSAKIYRMVIPYSPEEINQATKDAVSKNNLKAAYIRPAAFIGNVGLGLNPTSHVAEVMVAAIKMGTYLGEEGLTKGINAAVTSWNRVAPNTLPAGSKAGGNYLSSQLISGEAKRHGYDEGIGLDVNGQISEGAGENIFVIRNGIISTPPSTASILPGLTRDAMIHFARDAGYEVREEGLSRESLYLADEVFMTGTAAEVTPIRSIDQIEIGAGGRGPITEQLQSIFFGLFDGSTEDKYNWLELIEE